MIPLCVVGRGRVGHAIGALNSNIVTLSARTADFPKTLTDAVVDGARVLITARDSDGSARSNLDLAARIADTAHAAGATADHILHFSSYSVGRITGDYSNEKRLLEAAVRRGDVVGRALRIPILLIPDARFLFILGELRWGVETDVIHPKLTLPILALPDMINKISALPSGSQDLKILAGTMTTIEDLITRHKPIATKPTFPNLRISQLMEYSREIQCGNSPDTHYERQHRAVDL